MSKTTDTIAWVMKEEKIVKLTTLNKTYDISEKVSANLEKNDLYDKLEDKKVEVEIDENEGENGLITFLKVVDFKEDTKKEVTKEEVVKEDTKYTKKKELTVAGVSVKNSGVTFKEEEKVWYTLGEGIDPQKFKDECTKQVIEAVVEETEKGNDIIKSYVLKVEEKKEEYQPPKIENGVTPTTNKDNFYRIKQLENQVRFMKEAKESSFEAQASVNGANQTVSGMVSVDSKPDEVLKMIDKVAKHNFKLMQELKKKE